MYRKHPEAAAMLIILGFNDKPPSLTLHQPKCQWTLLLNNTDTEYAEPNTVSSDPAPSNLDLTSTQPTISLPAFPAWVYQQGSIP